MPSYSSQSHGAVAFLKEIGSLYRLHAPNIAEHVRERLDDIRRVEARIKEQYGVEIKGLDVLEVGPGQFLFQLTYFATHNRAAGIDPDVVVQGFHPLGYWTMLRQNGVRRTVKTMGRKLLAIDLRYASQLKKQLGLKKLPPRKTYTMDVCRMSFPESSFDLVYCRSVLHSLPDPGAALDEIARVLRPGGVAYISIHPYTSATGCLDARIYTSSRGDVQGWPHLRPGLAATLNPPNVYLNKLRIAEWRSLTAARMCGAECALTMGRQETTERARELQSQAELLEYSLDELTAGELVVLWRKPAVDGKPLRTAHASFAQAPATF